MICMPAAIGCAHWSFADEHPEDVLAGIYLDRVVGFLLEWPPSAGMESSVSVKIGQAVLIAGRKLSTQVTSANLVVRLHS